jgi:hypothetical protein
MTQAKEGGGTANLSAERHLNALKEQASALKKVTERRLTVLAGRAETGKTTVSGRYSIVIMKHL